MNKFLAISCMAVAAMAAPEAEADPYLLYGYYGGYPYGLGYAHAAVAPVAAGYASVSPSASVSIAGLAGAAVPAVAGGYAAAGRYVANSAGVVHVAKREAEADAEADPYYAYGYHGLGYAGYTVLDTPDLLATPATPTLTTMALATPTTPTSSLPPLLLRSRLSPLPLSLLPLPSSTLPSLPV